MELVCATYFDKVDKIVVIFAEYRVPYRVAALAATLGHTTPLRSYKPPVLIEKVLALAALIDHLFRRHANPYDK